MWYAYEAQLWGLAVWVWGLATAEQEPNMERFKEFFTWECKQQKLNKNKNKNNAMRRHEQV